MNFRELKEYLNKLTPEQLDEEVLITCDEGEDNQIFQLIDVWEHEDKDVFLFAASERYIEKVEEQRLAELN